MTAQCSWCGKFRKDIDCYRAVEVVSHDRLESWWEPVCRFCKPGLYARQDTP